MANKRWILIRGLSREAAHWGGFVELFQNHFLGEQVQCVDLPGTGIFNEEPSPRTVSEICDAVRAQVFETNKDPVRLLSISLGSMVAIEWMKSHPEEIEASVLMNTSVRGSGPFYRRLRWQIWGEFVRILSIQKPRDRERAIVDLLMNNVEARETALPLWTKIALERPITWQVLMNQLLAATQFKAVSEIPKMPVLILTGLGDRMVDPINSENLARQWQCPIKRHPWAGHDLPWDDPQWVIQSIEQWSKKELAFESAEKK